MASESDLVDVAVVGGGLAGLAAAMWCARYRRSVLIVDGDRPRNAAVRDTHGYLGWDGASPETLAGRCRGDVLRYPEVTSLVGVDVLAIHKGESHFDLTLQNADEARSLRLVLATGVRDQLPDIPGFEEHYGSSIFTCPSCDGYEAQDKVVVVMGDDEHVDAFAIGLLDWAADVTLLRPSGIRDRRVPADRIRSTGVRVVHGEAVQIVGECGSLSALRLADGSLVPCQLLFFTSATEQHSTLAMDLGCAISDEGCVVVDAEGRTSVEHVFAAGDMTPGPRLLQLAAAEGARAGIGAAVSLRGDAGAKNSPRPAPDAHEVLSR